MSISMLSKTLGNNVFCGIMFLGAHWLRIHQALGDFAATVEVVYADPPPGESTQWKAYAHEIASFILRNGPGYAVDDAARTSRMHQALMTKRLGELLSVINGPWWGKLRHYCRRDGSCCAGCDDASRRDVTVSRIAHALKCCLFNRKPGRPSDNKWTNVTPSYSTFGLCMAVHSSLLHVVKIATKPLQKYYFSAADATPESREADSRLDFNAVHGTRLRRMLSTLRDDATISAIAVFMVVSEPGRALTYFFMQACRVSSHRVHFSVSSVQTCTWLPQYSIFIATTHNACVCFATARFSDIVHVSHHRFPVSCSIAPRHLNQCCPTVVCRTCVILLRLTPVEPQSHCSTCLVY